MAIRSAFSLLILLTILPGVCPAGEDLDQLEQKAFQAAVAHVGPCVVRIETVGGRERLGETLLGMGPTTGLIVGADGHILSSEFNFLRRPDSILVQLPDDTRKPAQLVATDHSRNLVLLKIDAPKPLPVPDMGRRADLRVGQWTLAVGRTFPGNRPSMTVGVLSATNRIWGKAVQTDAAVSPANYGGPLIDLQGRVLGILAPLSPESREVAGGSEWYDSGIGFAVAADDIPSIVAKLKRGKDLYAGLMGVSVGQGDPNTSPAIVTACQPGSPAAKAGLRSGDRITRLAGREVRIANDMKQILGPLYAGDTVELVALRGKEEIRRKIELVAELKPYQLPALGVLPMRDSADEEEQGVAVRDTWAGSPAAKAGIARGDVLVQLDKTVLKDAEQLRRLIAQREPGESVEVTVRNSRETRKAKIQLGVLPDALPTVDPPSAHAAEIASADETEKADEKRPIGRITVKAPELKNEAWAYVPDGYTPSRPAGLLVWLPEPGQIDEKGLLSRFKAACDRHNVVLLVPKPDDSRKWTPGDVDDVARVAEELLARYSVDRRRIAVGGGGSGGVAALGVALSQRELVRAVAVIDAAPASRLPENDPVHPLAFHFATVTKSSQAARVNLAVAALRKMKYPVSVEPHGAVPGPPKPDQAQRFARWIDTLDRI